MYLPQPKKKKKKTLERKLLELSANWKQKIAAVEIVGYLKWSVRMSTTERMDSEEMVLARLERNRLKWFGDILWMKQDKLQKKGRLFGTPQ